MVHISRPGYAPSGYWYVDPESWDVVYVKRDNQRKPGYIPIEEFFNDLNGGLDFSDRVDWGMCCFPADLIRAYCRFHDVNVSIPDQDYFHGSDLPCQMDANGVAAWAEMAGGEFASWHLENKQACHESAIELALGAIVDELDYTPG